ncbi:hypothetical protein F5X97DRAFT_332225 [Nemania serpens]|nr:hypothetical protein F5X97DRAFT_332225 [Nemania serpens]
MHRRHHGSRPADVVYMQIRYHEHNTVRIKTIDNQRADTRYLLRNQIRRMDEEIRTAAEVIAEVQIDSPSSDVVLTANGYANKAALKNALVNIDYDCMKDVLEFMLRDGAYVYKAVCQQEVVGVVVIIQLTREFSMPAGPSGTSSPQGLSFPLLDDLDAVEAYARSSAVDHEVTCQLRSYLNSRLRHHGIGKLWELSVLSVKEGFRHEHIGRTLVRHALSQIPAGDTVTILAEPGKEAMYRHLGFDYAMSASNTLQAMSIRPEWARRGRDYTFHMMVLQK